MDINEKTFKVVVPAELSKSDDGEWRVKGVASTASRDQQGEVIIQKGIDPSAIDEGKAYFNWDHGRGPENILGPIDSYQKQPGQFIVEGRLFKNHSRAKVVHEIMSSLTKADRGRMGMSVEGKILERGGEDGKTIKKCKITAVALTMNPVNQDSQADLVKSLSSDSLAIDFETKKADSENIPNEDTFKASEVLEIVNKALSVGSAYATSAPSDLSGGEALSQEELDKKAKNAEYCSKCEVKKALCKCSSKKLKKMSKDIYKSTMGELLDSIQKLYPEASRSQLWETVKDRLNKRFPEVF